MNSDAAEGGNEERGVALADAILWPGSEGWEAEILRFKTFYLLALFKFSSLFSLVRSKFLKWSYPDR